MTNKTIALCLCLLGFAAPAAFAQNATTSGYGEATGVLPAPPAPPAAPAAPAAPAPTSGSSNVSPSGTSPATAASQPAASAPATPAQAPAAAVSTNGDRLPFTGMDIAVFLLVGLVLVGAGVGLRRLTSGPPAA
jgi:hypothetical protein